MAFDWKSIVKTVAPTIATVLGGPLAGMGVRAISEALLGNPNGTEAEIEIALQGTSPETLLKLKDAENKFKLDIKKLDLDITKLDYDDADSARRRQMTVQDRTPDILAYLLITAFVGALMSLYNIEIPEGNKASIYAMLATLGTLTIAAMAYFHGSSRGSARKDAAIQEMRK